MVVDPNWRFLKDDDAEKARKIKLMLVDDQWWERIDFLISFTNPIVKLLRKTDRYANAALGLWKVGLHDRTSLWNCSQEWKQEPYWWCKVGMSCTELLIFLDVNKCHQRHDLISYIQCSLWVFQHFTTLIRWLLAGFMLFGCKLEYLPFYLKILKINKCIRRIPESYFLRLAESDTRTWVGLQHPHPCPRNTADYMFLLSIEHKILHFVLLTLALLYNLAGCTLNSQPPAPNHSPAPAITLHSPKSRYGQLELFSSQQDGKLQRQLRHLV